VLSGQLADYDSTPPALSIVTPYPLSAVAETDIPCRKPFQDRPLKEIQGSAAPTTQPLQSRPTPHSVGTPRLGRPSRPLPGPTLGRSGRIRSCTPRVRPAWQTCLAVHMPASGRPPLLGRCRSRRFRRGASLGTSQKRLGSPLSDGRSPPTGFRRLRYLPFARPLSHNSECYRESLGRRCIFSRLRGVQSGAFQRGLSSPLSCVGPLGTDPLSRGAGKPKRTRSR